MALVDIGVRTLSNRLPRVISPKTHAIIDYATAGTFIAMGAFLWKRHKRAAITSWVCGAQEIALSMLTDYPGGVAKVVDLPTHGRIDAGFSGLVASAPNLVGFAHEWPSIYFRSQGLALAAVTGMTQFEPEQRRERRAA